MTRLRTVLLAGVMVASALAGGGSQAATDCNWSTYGHDLGRSMAQTSACSKITIANVATMHPKWIFNAGAPVTAQPAVVDGTVYVGAADGTFYALPADGIGIVTPKWTFTNTDSNQDSYGKFVSSPAVADVAGSRVVVGGGSTLYVLDAATGTKLASECFDPRTNPAVRCKGSTDIIELESSPAVVVSADGKSAKIYVGVDYNEGGPGRGGVVRLTLTHNGSWSLHPDWKFDPEGLTTYHTDVFSAGGVGQGCGNVWSSPTVDVNAQLVYFDTSNCDTGRYRNHALYGGESVFAINMNTGALAWCYSPRPVNDSDLDYGATPNLLPNNRVGAGGKDGAYYSFNRRATRPVDTNAATACRGPHAQAPAWSTTVATGGSINGIIGTPAVGKAQGGDAIFATNAIPNPDQSTLFAPQRLTTLHAINAANGEVLWDAPNVFPAYAGPAYSNKLVFMPDTFGMNFTVYNADFGIPVWSFPMFAPSGPPAIVGDSVYIGSGVEPSSGTPVLSQIGFVFAFQVVAP